MMILITGQPGNGKTLRALALMDEEYQRNQQGVKEGKESSRRFFTNIEGATTDVNPDAFSWLEKLPTDNDWTKLPDGSYVVFDEAHSDGKTPELAHYGVQFPSTGRPGESDDPRVRSMSTHRHRGFDLVFVTQYPNKVHHDVRKLCGKHIHMNRAMGLQRAGCFTWTRVQPEVYDEKEREKAEEEIWTFPASLYTRYKSASLHTATYKFKVPGRVWAGLARVLVMVLVCWLLWIFIFKPDAKEPKENASESEAAIGLAPAGAPEPRSMSSMGIHEYLQQREPRVGAMPWSAPLFDERDVVSQPELYCMASDPGVDAQGRMQRQTCTCLTEQGTRYTMRNVDCRAVARNGPAYNPYKAPREEREREIADAAPDASPQATLSVVIPADAVQGGGTGVKQEGAKGQQ